MKGKFPASFETYQAVEPGDFVFCLFDVEETPRTVGLSSYAGMITGAYDVFESRDPAVNDYLIEFLLTIDRAKKLQPLYRGLRKTVPRPALMSMRVPVPPQSEMAAIVSDVRSRTASINDAISALSREIELLREYRKQLFSDVVTGRLDIRDAVAGLPPVQPYDGEQSGLRHELDLTEDADAD